MEEPIEIVNGFEFHFAGAGAAASLRPHLDAIIARPESLPGFFATRKGRIRRSFTFRFQLGDRGVYCKKVEPKSVVAYAKDLFRPSRARNFWEQTRKLETMGFGGPKLLAFAERRCGPFVLESLLICEEVANARPLSEHLKTLVAASNSRLVLWPFLRELGAFVGRMHRAGVAHGDLRLNNLLVQTVGQGTRFVLLDNDRTEIFARPPRRLLLKNLQQLNLIFLRGLNLGDRLRFFDAYHEAMGGAAHDREERLMEVIASLERRLRRYIAESKDLRDVPSDGGYRALMRAINKRKTR
jgi:hypothetical protein